MKVDIYSKETIERLLKNDFPDNVAVISFYDPANPRTGEKDTLVDYSHKTFRVFAVAIHDIDLEILSDYGLTYDTYFPEVKALAEFIYNAYSDGLDIICQCVYGQSRSAACAAAILEHFYHNGISVFADYRYYPNQMVFHKVFDALEAVYAQKSQNTKINSVKYEDALIGIWWYTDDGEIWAVSIPTNKGIPNGMYLQYSNTENHMTLWSFIIKKYVKDPALQQSIISKGYKSIERGRVIYNTATMVYEIICSNDLINNKDFRKNIVNYYHLSENRFEFVLMNHYYKIELTGNPALDEFIENNQY